MQKVRLTSEQYSSTILNQLHTASSILLDDRFSMLLLVVHAPVAATRCCSRSRFSRDACDPLTWPVWLWLLAPVMQHSTALPHDSRTDRGVFSLPPTFPSTSSLFIRLFLLRSLTTLSFPLATLRAFLSPAEVQAYSQAYLQLMCELVYLMCPAQ